MLRGIQIILLSFFFSGLVSAQVNSDSTVTVKNKKAVYSTARKATIMSAVIPGLGQVYNKKYWKPPVIYAGLAGFGYFFYVNNTSYNNYRAALRYSVDNGGSAVVDGRNYSTTQLQSQKLYYRKFRDLGAIGVVAMYLLNVVDANVDAHLKTFDVSDDLSLNVNPWVGNYVAGNNIATATGVSIKLNFK